MAAAAMMLSVACEEFQPVFTGTYPNPPSYAETGNMYYDASIIPEGKCISIKDLAGRFKSEAASANVTDFKKWCWLVSEDLWVKGRITTSDRSGNFYKSFYIQDEPDGPGIEVKIGKNSLYNEYHLGQEIYIKLDGLAIGEYGWKDGNYGGEGMVQIGGYEPEYDETEEHGKHEREYATCYIEHQYLINNHVFKGDPSDIQIVKPRVVKASELPVISKANPSNTDTWRVRDQTQADNANIGALITLEDLSYGDEIFALLYIRGTESNKESKNRIFLAQSDKVDYPDLTWGVDTWALSKTSFKNHVNSGAWDIAMVGNANDYTGETLADVKDELLRNVNAYSVSQYFEMPGAEIPVQVRSSGFSKFADLKIDKDVLSGDKTITLTGILSIYQGAYQFILTDNDNQFIQDVLNK